MKRKTLVIILSITSIILITALLYLTLSGMKEDPPRRPVIDIVRSVKAMPVKYDEIYTEISAGGRVNSRTDIIISAEVSGKILPGDVPLKKGQNFNEGDLLIKIYDTEASLALKAKKSSFLNIIASVLPEFKISYTNSYDNWLKYFESIKIDEELPALPEFNSTQEKVFLASRNLLSDFYSIKSDESRFRKYNIYAPFKGAFMDVTAEVGAIANPGARLARIVNTIDLELEVPIEISEAKWLKKGDNVLITSGDKNKKWDGRINRISQTVDEATQSINVFVEVDFNKNNPIYKGQYLTATFKGIKLKNSMELPRAAVFNTNEVFIVIDSLLVKSEIDIKKINQQTLYFNGISEGVDIVIEPLINVSEKTKVKVLDN